MDLISLKDYINNIILDWNILDAGKNETYVSDKSLK